MTVTTAEDAGIAIAATNGVAQPANRDLARVKRCDMILSSHAETRSDLEALRLCMCQSGVVHPLIQLKPPTPVRDRDMSGRRPPN